jgi:hypothetical protein
MLSLLPLLVSSVYAATSGFLVLSGLKGLEKSGFTLASYGLI